MNDLIEETATFFETRADTNQYTKGCMQRRAMILTMLAHRDPLTTNQIWRRTTNGNRASAVRMVKSMVRQGLARSRFIRKATDQTSRKYYLTDKGMRVGLAVAHEYGTNPLGIDYQGILEELFQPEPKREATDVLMSYWFLNMRSRGMMKYLMQYNHDYVKDTETKGKFISPAYFFMKQLPDMPRYAKTVGESFELALKALTPAEQVEAMQFWKGTAQGLMGEVGRVFENQDIQDFVTASMKDPTNLVISDIKKKCRNCGKAIGEVKFRPEVVMKSMSGEPELPCPHCGANLLKGAKFTEEDAKEMAEWLARPKSSGLHKGKARQKVVSNSVSVSVEDEKRL